MSEHVMERRTRTRLQDLAAAVLAGDDIEDLLTLLTSLAREDLGARTAALVMPCGPDCWSVEIADGEDATAVLGYEPPDHAPLRLALRSGDEAAIEALTAPDVLGPLTRPLPSGSSTLAAPVVPVDGEIGALLVLREDADALTADADAERLAALAMLIGVALAGGRPADAETVELDHERRRIARDLHDLAIQELFAVGMELESVQDLLRTPGGQASPTRVSRAVESSVQGVESAVRQIRQIVQSLRRDRVEATLTERLRHECGLAISGLGFAPSLRLPSNAAGMDAEVPQEVAEDVVAVVREALANAARHAHASAVAVVVSLFSEGVDRVVQVSVSDNGRGIDPSVTRRSGLANMSSRARRHQGWVDAIPLEPGTMISWRVTLPPR
ncbi:MAG: histidine kinase [Brachybacterium sp.]|nr:histidine kinase [Brachybacterium sp.]